MEMKFEDPEIERGVRALGRFITTSHANINSWLVKVHVDDREVCDIKMIDLVSKIAHKYVRNHKGRFATVEQKNGRRDLVTEQIPLDKATVSVFRRKEGHQD